MFIIIVAARLRVGSWAVGFDVTVVGGFVAVCLDRVADEL